MADTFIKFNGEDDVSAWCKLHGAEFTGEKIPFGALVYFKPSGARANEQAHKFDPKGIPGVSQFGTIADLKSAVQQSFGQRFLRLATPDGCLFDPAESLRLSGLKDGDSLTAVSQQPKVAATGRAFALWCDRVVTWGNPDDGGDSSGVQHQFRKVQQICSTDYAFAAILADGNVVTWGDRRYGGDSSGVQHLLRNFQRIFAQHFGAFGAMLADGNVVTWGSLDYDRCPVRNARQMCNTNLACAAILANGSVVTWGDPDDGGDSSGVQDQPRNVQQICSTDSAFAAVLADGGDMSICQNRSKSTVCATEWRGAFPWVVVTAPGCKTSSEMSSRFVAQTVPLLPFW